MEQTIEHWAAVSQQAPLVKKLADFLPVAIRIQWPGADVLMAGSLLLFRQEFQWMSIPTCLSYLRHQTLPKT